MPSYPISAPQPENTVKASQSNSATVAASTTAVDCLADTNADNRIGVTVENPGETIAYIAQGNATANAATATNHAYLIPANRVVALSPIPSGELNVILESGSASLTVIEFLK